MVCRWRWRPRRRSAAPFARKRFSQHHVQFDQARSNLAGFVLAYRHLEFFFIQTPEFLQTLRRYGHIPSVSRTPIRRKTGRRARQDILPPCRQASMPFANCTSPAIGNSWRHCTACRCSRRNPRAGLTRWRRRRCGLLARQWFHQKCIKVHQTPSNLGCFVLGQPFAAFHLVEVDELLNFVVAKYHGKSLDGAQFRQE